MQSGNKSIVHPSQPESALFLAARPILGSSYNEKTRWDGLLSATRNVAGDCLNLWFS